MIKFFRRSYTKDERNLFSFMKGVHLFAQLTEDELYHFLPYMYLRKYKQNEAVFFRNDPSNAIYIVRNGVIKISLDIEGNMEELAKAHANETLGDNTLLPEAKRMFNAIICSEEAELYIIPKINIQAIFEDYPRIKAKMLSAFAQDYDMYISNLFRAYRSAYGFFDLKMVYQDA